MDLLEFYESVRLNVRLRDDIRLSILKKEAEWGVNEAGPKFTPTKLNKSKGCEICLGSYPCVQPISLFYFKLQEEHQQLDITLTKADEDVMPHHIRHST